MRKYYQKQLLDLTETLHEAHVEIKRLLFNENTQAVIGLLFDCQESAVRIGGFIEQLEGEGTKTVSFLEEYCDLLYRMGVSIHDSGRDSGLLKQLQKQLFVIENSIRSELKPDKIEIVFLPYKASMWDSMESVWLEAKEDPQCDAYVVPIPYYDKQPDGNFGRMHYEGGQYPDYVPVVDWQKYNIEERHPDIIFIHNPYDDGNIISSVHSDYYCEKLKEHTELLAYLPYFVVSDDVPEHFLVCAGTMYADKVFVQSEKIRGTYTRAFKEFEKNNRCVGRFGKAEAKFIASGSPKFDKVINSKPEDFSVPGEWLRLIERSDGTQKKIVLYNTTIGAILSGNEEYVRKLRHVLDIFRKRDDVVLWWRPHPLNEATYQAMRPQLLDEYERIITEYKNAGFGIYDDTPDLHRAINLSSYYYGDDSSLVAMYQCTGKPVILQNRRIVDKAENQGGLIFENFYDDGDSFWFTAFDFNGLFKTNKKTWGAEYKGSFHNEPQSNRLYSSIVARRGKLFFTPFAADAVGVFDLAEQKFSAVEIREPQQKKGATYNHLSKFSFAVAYKEWIFFFPRTYPAIVRYNPETGEMDYYDEWIDSLDEYIFDDGLFYFCNGQVSDSEVTMYCSNANVTVVFDMEKCSYQVINHFNSADLYGSICYDGDCYWLSPLSESASIIKLNVKTGERTEITQFPPEFIPGRRPVWCLAYADGYIWMLPGVANESLKINVEKNEVEITDVFKAENIIDDGVTEQWKFSFIQSIEDKLYAFDSTVNKLMEYDTRNNTVRKECIKVDKNASVSLDMLYYYYRFDQYSKYIKATDCIINETSFATIDDIIDSMMYRDFNDKFESVLQKQIELRSEEIAHPDGKACEEIYSTCKKAVMES